MNSFRGSIVLVAATLVMGCGQDKAVDTVPVATTQPANNVNVAEDRSADLSNVEPQSGQFGFLSALERCQVSARRADQENCDAEERQSLSIKRPLLIGANVHSISLNTTEPAILKVNLTISEGPPPYNVEYHGAWPQSNSSWVSGFELTLGEKPIWMSLSMYADLAGPKYFEIFERGDLKKDGRLLVRLLYDGASTSSTVQYTIMAGDCPNDDSIPLADRLHVSERLVWYPPMAGDSLEKTFYRFPLCN